MNKSNMNRFSRLFAAVMANLIPFIRTSLYPYYKIRLSFFLTGLWCVWCKWESGKSIHLPPIWPGFKSWCWHQIWLSLLMVLSLATLLKKQQCISNSYYNSIWNTGIHLKNELLRTSKCFVGKRYYYNSCNIVQHVSTS